VGYVGEVHPDVLTRWSWSRPLTIAYAELDLHCIPEPTAPSYRVVPRFPATSRDLSLDLAEEVPASRVVEALFISAAKVATDAVCLTPADAGRRAIELVEEYRGEGIGSGRRALLLRLGYRATDRAPQEEEVRALHETIVAAALDNLRRDDPDARVR